MKTWKIKATISVADSWVADGFDLKQRIDEIESDLRSQLPYAFGHEIKVKVRIESSPSPEVIEALQSGDTEPED